MNTHDLRPLSSTFKRKPAAIGTSSALSGCLVALVNVALVVWAGANPACAVPDRED
jgi:hypothetical protein